MRILIPVIVGNFFAQLSSIFSAVISLSFACYMIKTFSFFESSSFTFICHSSRSALEEIFVQVDLVWDTSRFAFAVSFSSSRSHHGALWFFITSWLFVGLVSGYFNGFFRPLVGGFLFENTSRHQMMSFEKTNFLQRICEVLWNILKIFASG